MYETSNKNGGVNKWHNKNRNVCCPDSSGDQYIASKLKEKIERMYTLGVKEHKRTESFMIFQKEVHAYVISNYKQPSNIT